ncbi:MAG TPA: M1 family metallopeptidase [Chitinophagaceae bacterium]|nr:M1 family metallopeptidase [Chitinophagaceae bacterium]
MLPKSLLFIFCFAVALVHFSCAQPLNQKQGFTKQDSLRGSINAERSWWDAVQYNISVKPDYDQKTITGSNNIRFKVLKAGNKMQLDMQQPMEIKSITWAGQKLQSEREGNVYHVTFPQTLQAGKIETIDVAFEGKPREAKRPPWDGGWIWRKDEKGRPWMSVACQGLGASVWYPCKDHQSDEPDSATLSMTVPDSLVAVGNGRLRNKKDNGDQTSTWTWAVTNPINNYNIIPYIGKYVHWHEDYAGEKGNLDCDYWVLDHDLEKAKEQFKQSALMLKCFENWFGPFPWYEDGFKLVESPHLGMEHQSAVAYGNKFRNGYLGRDLSGSGWGLKWDFIIIHESAHEWFANNITSKDIADMWIHESFANYSETLFTECMFNKQAGQEYVAGTRAGISNDIPIIGAYGVNQEGSGDMYPKGGNMLHNIRQVINDDEKFRQILRGLNKDFYHKTVTTQEIEQYFIKKSGKDLQKIFDQYLRTIQIPTLEYYYDDKKLFYRYADAVNGFNMPLRINDGKSTIEIKPVTDKWNSIKLKEKENTDSVKNVAYYINWKKVK